VRTTAPGWDAAVSAPAWSLLEVSAPAWSLLETVLAGRADSVEVLAAGGCCACQLPLDGSCARQARQVYAEAAAALGLSGDAVYDGKTIASELAANTLHALENVEFDGAGKWPLAGAPELWLYLRTAGAGRWELVCKVFDSLAGWHERTPGAPATPGGSTAADAVSGRGIQLVAGLAGGRWGHHLSRSRLGGWKVPGKAVWFAQPVPPEIPAARWRPPAPGDTGRILEAMLADRGLGGSLLRMEEPASGMSVLSVRCGLTVWCRDRMIWWRAPSGGYQRRSTTDLVETVEQIVCACAEMAAAASGWTAAGAVATRAGA
jgi:hypothetical protein